MVRSQMVLTLNNFSACRRIVETVDVPPPLWIVNLMVLFDLFLQNFQLANTRDGNFVLVSHQTSVEMNCER